MSIFQRKINYMGVKLPVIPLSYGLVLEGVLSEEQLRDKLFTNPKKIIESTGYKLE